MEDTKQECEVFTSEQRDFIRKEIEVQTSPLFNFMKDMQGNMKDDIYEAVDKGFKKAQKEQCTQHKEEIRQIDRKYLIWCTGLSVALIIMLIIML